MNFIVAQAHAVRGPTMSRHLRNDTWPADASATAALTVALPHCRGTPLETRSSRPLTAISPADAGQGSGRCLGRGLGALCWGAVTKSMPIGCTALLIS